MAGSYLGDAGVFLVDTIFGLYILLVLLRFLFQWVRADFYNPISQFLVAATNPPLIFVRRFIPGVWGLDLAAVVLMLALAVLKVYLLAWMGGVNPKLTGVMVFAIGELLQLTVYVFMVAVIIAFFIISFGPQASQSQFQCTGRQTYAARVGGVEISEHSWRFAANGLGIGGGSGERARAMRAREAIMDRLIERELFAQAAEAAGADLLQLSFHKMKKLLRRG